VLTGGLGHRVGKAREQRRAEAAWRAFIKSGSPSQAAEAQLNLGLLLAQRQDVNGAMAAFQQAIDSGHMEHAPAAALNLGAMLAAAGNGDGATRAYRARTARASSRAIRGMHPRRHAAWACCSMSEATPTVPGPRSGRRSARRTASSQRRRE
jgi:hypothetical protein